MQADQFVRYASNLYLFCREVLGFADMNAQHQALCDFMQHETKPKIVLTPRYTFKSSVATDGYILWRLLRNDSLRVLIYSDSVERAQARLTEIKNHLLGLKRGSTFRQLYGPWEIDPKKGFWNQAAITIRPRQTAHAEPSIDTAGLESSKVGAHYDLIIFDDMVTRENTTTKDLMDKVYACYQASRSLLRPGGDIVIVGTFWHFGDMYRRLLAENDATHQFAVFLRDAEVSPEGDPYPYASIGLTKPFLAEQKASQGSLLYSCLYRLSPQDDEAAIFKHKDFRFYPPVVSSEAIRRWRATLYITCVLDAIPPPTSDRGDDAAILVVGTDAEHRMYLLDGVAGRLTPDQQLDEVFSLHAQWTFKQFGLETNAFQRMLKTSLEERLRQARKAPTWQPFSIREFQGTTQGNKEQRIQGLQPWHEQGMILFPGERLETLHGLWSQLAFQMLQFPHSAKDDLLDALAYHLQLVQRGTTPTPTPTYPYTSAAWYERECRKEELQEQARRPRWRRPLLPALSLS